MRFMLARSVERKVDNAESTAQLQCSSPDAALHRVRGDVRWTAVLICVDVGRPRLQLPDLVQFVLFARGCDTRVVGGEADEEVYNAEENDDGTEVGDIVPEINY